METSLIDQLMATRPEPAGRSVADFAVAVGVSRAFIYSLPPEKRPISIHIEKRRIVTEQPRDWLKRMEEAQGVPNEAG